MVCINHTNVAKARREMENILQPSLDVILRSVQTEPIGEHIFRSDTIFRQDAVIIGEYVAIADDNGVKVLSVNAFIKENKEKDKQNGVAWGGRGWGGAIDEIQDKSVCSMAANNEKLMNIVGGMITIKSILEMPDNDEPLADYRPAFQATVERFMRYVVEGGVYISN